MMKRLRVSYSIVRSASDDRENITRNFTMPGINAILPTVLFNVL
jgi:hypothetical protein